MDEGDEMRPVLVSREASLEFLTTKESAKQNIFTGNTGDYFENRIY
jgi:hypothetical protein